MNLGAPGVLAHPSESIIAGLIAHNLKPYKDGSQLAHPALCQEITNFILSHVVSDDTLVVSLIGGAACGKTTLATHLVALCRNMGTSAGSFSTDDFVVGDRAYRRTHLEGHSPIAKYDVELLNKKLEAICANHNPMTTISVPHYDEISGRAVAAGEESFPIKIGPVRILIVEGDFDFVKRPNLCIYLHMPDEERLGLRLKRDLEKRGESKPEPVIESFTLRQTQQHFPFTLPTAKRASLLVVLNREFGGKLFVTRK